MSTHAGAPLLAALAYTLLHMPFLNPQCGPIAVRGAEKGDALCVQIRSIKPTVRQS